MRKFVALALVASLSVSSALAATETAPVAPLAPGKPAGVKKADIEAGGVVLWVGVLGLAAGIAILASGTQGNGSSSGTK